MSSTPLVPVAPEPSSESHVSALANRNFISLIVTTPSLADGLVYHLQQTVKGLHLKGQHVLTRPVGGQTEVRISQVLQQQLASVTVPFGHRVS